MAVVYVPITVPIWREYHNQIKEASRQYKKTPQEVVEKSLSISLLVAKYKQEETEVIWEDCYTDRVYSYLIGVPTPDLALKMGVSEKVKRFLIEGASRFHLDFDTFVHKAIASYLIGLERSQACELLLKGPMGTIFHDGSKRTLPNLFPPPLRRSDPA